MNGAQVAAFVLLGEELSQLPQMLQAAFRHDWVASYQVGFGPPLVRSSQGLNLQVKQAKSALDKLQAYFDHCILNEEARRSLAQKHRERLVRKMGPIEAEALDRSSVDIIDLVLRLHVPANAPPRAMGQMDRAGIDLRQIPDNISPEELSARFWLHLHDPRNSRLLHIEEVTAKAGDPERATALELRVPIQMGWFWAKWAEDYAKVSGYAVVDLGEPASHARVLKNGARV